MAEMSIVTTKKAKMAETLKNVPPKDLELSVV
jgi:hypothetical protein